MKVTLIAHTRFNAEVAYDLTGWQPDSEFADGASYLSEFAGRACYQSWSKPNPATASNAGYLKHILDVEHYSVLEHGSATFYIEDVSRSLTHEFIRHRHMSPSQLSQRYVKLDLDTSPVVPPLYQPEWSDEEDQEMSETEQILREVWHDAVTAYYRLVAIWEQRLAQRGYAPGSTELRKRAREAARCVLPNMTPTSIVMTGNHLTWRHFLKLRGSMAADMEIRELALEVWSQLSSVEPNLYQDFEKCAATGGELYLLVRDDD